MFWWHHLEQIRPSIREDGAGGAVDEDEDDVPVVVGMERWRWTDWDEYSSLALQ